ncbi:MAG: YigZ family protein [Clostridia bacterium]|nr:YigZ family protein [Clostridia bacterium]
MYFTVGGDGTAEVSVKHSKFIAFCSAVANDDEAEAFVKAVKKRYTDATHAPYAYLLGERSERSRASDDGEPSGTSGIPILEAIKNSGLTNTAVVVVHYFGGIKLGTGGLARAYADAALAALSAAGKRAFDKCAVFVISCDYGLISTVQNQIYAFNGVVQNADYTGGAVLTVAVPAIKKEAFLVALADATSGRATQEEKEERYCEVKRC